LQKPFLASFAMGLVRDLLEQENKEAAG